VEVTENLLMSRCMYKEGNENSRPSVCSIHMVSIYVRLKTSLWPPMKRGAVAV
jgi:hypothetical protein